MATDSLVIKHFPCHFSDQDKEELLTECGAVKVKSISSKHNKYNITFAQFPSEAHAANALRHLHQQQLAGSLLCVEYAKTSMLPKPEVYTDKLRVRSSCGSEAMVSRFVEKLSRWAEVRAPVPGHLRYQYPPPTQATLRNIERLLQTTPRLYTQLLHLINKMNLPCPISEEATPPPEMLTKQQQFVEDLPLSSSSESELSSGSPSRASQFKETVPNLAKKPKKVLKRRLLKIPPAAVHTRHNKPTLEQVFENASTLKDEPAQKKPRLEKDGEYELVGGFGVLHPVRGPPESASVTVEDTRDPREEERLEKATFECITKEALAANRINEKERALLPVFKSYTLGPATCRLYIKNLAKQTTEQHLRFIYQRYLNETHDTLDIRLMQEGRMKGQAFVTLGSVELAVQAVTETNGYILNDKPMVVQFARSAAT